MAEFTATPSSDALCDDACSVGWLLCRYPERQPNEWTHVHLVKCRACRIGAEAAARQWPERWKLVYDLQTLYWAENVESPPLSPSSGL